MIEFEMQAERIEERLEAKRRAAVNAELLESLQTRTHAEAVQAFLSELVVPVGVKTARERLQCEFA